MLATVVGLGATWMTATRGTDLGTLTIGAWTARPKTGTADVDPYSRASIARSGELPVGTGDGVAFSATADDRKRPLDGRCDADAARCADALHRDRGVPMIRLLFTIIAGVLLGGVVHLVSVLALPRIATQDAYSRLTPMTKLNAVTPLPLADPNNAPMPFMDPAFAIAICRYDLSSGSLKLTVPVSQAYTSVSFYTRNEVAYYAINDRSAGRKVIELDLMTAEQHAQLPEDEEVTAADRLIIDSPSATGLIVMKALAPEPGLMPQAQASLAASSCKVQTEPPAKQAEAPPAKR